MLATVTVRFTPLSPGSIFWRGWQRYVLKDPETGTIIELEGGNRCDIRLESDGKSEEHDGD